MRGLFYGGLFVLVVIVHLALTGALREQGWSPSASLLTSGAAVLGLVLALVNAADWVGEKRAAAREILRMKQGLPAGPCCVVWTTKAPVEETEEGMPWDVVGPVRARFPKLARRLGVEGVAVAEFEVGADGRAKNVHWVYAWPSDVFFDAAREALNVARFMPKPDVHVRFGASYRIPFVFRIAGATKLSERGRRARRFRPTLHAAQQAVEKIRQGAGTPPLTR
jgi:TonB family protein